jgi:hypothetical protein
MWCNVYGVIVCTQELQSSTKSALETYLQVTSLSNHHMPFSAASCILDCQNDLAFALSIA